MVQDLLGSLGGASPQGAALGALKELAPKSSASSSASSSAGFTTGGSTFGAFNVGAGAGADTSIVTLAVIAGIAVLAWLVIKKS